MYCLNVDRATLKEPLQEIINTAEAEGMSRLVAPVDPADPTERQVSCREIWDNCPHWAPICDENKWCVAG